MHSIKKNCCRYRWNFQKITLIQKLSFCTKIQFGRQKTKNNIFGAFKSQNVDF